MVERKGSKRKGQSVLGFPSRAAFRRIENEGGHRDRGREGRNKSSASNRGRASARFYSRTLNSIAIGFPARSSYASLFLLRTAELRLAPFPSGASSRPLATLSPQPQSTPSHIVGRLLARENLIASDAIKHPGDEGDRPFPSFAG